MVPNILNVSWCNSAGSLSEWSGVSESYVVCARPTSHSSNEKMLALSGSFEADLVFHTSGMGESPKLNSSGSMDFVWADLFNSMTVSTRYTWASTVPVGRAVSFRDSFLSNIVKLLVSMTDGGSTTGGTSTPDGRLVISSASTIRILLLIRSR